MDNHHPRYYYLDNLKWALIILVALHHTAITTIPATFDTFGFNLPTIQSMQWQYGILNQIPAYSQSFFMALFFLISAYFVIPSLNKKGSKKFLLDRAIRLGIPTLITVFVLIPLFAYHLAVMNFLNFARSGNIMLGVMWFAWVLLLFNVFYVLYRRLFNNTPIHPVQKPFPAIWKIVLFTVLIIPFNYLGLYLNNTLGDDFLGFHHLKYFPLYIAMFYFGIQAYKNQWLDQIQAKHAFLGIIMWVISILFIWPIVDGYGFDGYLFVRGFTVVGMSLFLIYGFKVLFNAKNRFTLFMSRSAYATYFIHVFILVVIFKVYRHFMFQIPMLNFVLMAIPTVILSFLIGYGLCKLPVFKRIF